MNGRLQQEEMQEKAAFCSLRQRRVIFPAAFRVKLND